MAASGIFAENALAMHRQGLAVLPLGADRKPSISGFDRWATRPGLRTLGKWIRDHPGDNIAIIPGLSGVLVADCDNAIQDAAVEQLLGTTPLKVLSRRGHHRYYRTVDQRLPGNLRQFGLDVDLKAGRNIPKVEDFGCALDLAWLRRTRNCLPGHTGRITWSHRRIQKASVGYTVEPGGLRLSYQLSTNGTGASVTEVLPIVTTATQFGGRRHWFSCPGCGRRCRIVYHSERFRCRQCLGAHYESKFQNEALNICARRWRLRSLLEARGGMSWPLALDDGLPPKPPRMRWKTYRRLQALDQQLERRWNGWIHSRLQRIDPRLKMGDDFLARLEAQTAPAISYPRNSGSPAS